MPSSSIPRIQWIKTAPSDPALWASATPALAVHAYVYRCITLRANAVASLTYLDGDAPADIPAHALARCETSLCTHGALYVERSSRAVLNPAAMSIEANAQAGITAFVWRSGGVARRYRPDEIAYATLWHPGSDIGPGLAPLRVAQDAASTALAAEQFTRLFFEQGALPPIVIEPAEGGSITDTDAEAIRTVWQRMVAGARNAWRALVLRRSMSVRSLDMPAIDKLAMRDVDDISLRRIATAFGVPVTMITDAANYATAREHRVSFWRDTVIPEAEIIASAWSVALGREISIRYDDIEALAEDEAAKRASIVELHNAGIITTAEARRMIGIDDSADDAIAITRAALDELDAWRRKSRSRDMKAAEWTPEALPADWVRAVRTLADLGADPFAWARHIDLKAAGRINPQLTREEREIADAVAAVLDEHMTEDGEWDAESFARDLRAAVSRAMFAIALDSAVAAMIASAGFADAERAYDFAARWADEYAFGLVKGITETTAQRIRDALEASRRNDWPREMLVERLSRVFGRVRAEMIATTELTRAYSQGTEIARQIMHDFGVERVHVWRTAQDERVCQICGPRNGRAQGDGWDELPPAHVSCRCWTTLERKRRGRR